MSPRSASEGCVFHWRVLNRSAVGLTNDLVEQAIRFVVTKKVKNKCREHEPRLEVSCMKGLIPHGWAAMRRSRSMDDDSQKRVGVVGPTRATPASLGLHLR